MIHIVICDNKTNELDKIINKERTVLLRGSQTRRIPNSRIFVDDELYFVLKGDKVSNYHAVVKNADSYRGLTEIEINKIIDKYNDRLHLTVEEEKKWKKKCLCVIEFEKLEKIDEITVPEYTLLEDWIMIDSIDDIK